MLIQKPNLTKITFPQFRNWAIINFLLATGVRAQTLHNVKNSDIDFNNNRINLGYMKNRKAYIIPLSVRLSEVLTEYMDFRKGEYNDKLFCTEEGEPLTLEGLNSAIQRYNNSLGVE